MSDPSVDHTAPEAGLAPVVALTRELVSVGARSGEEGPVAEIVMRRMAELGFRDIARDVLGNVTGFVGPESGPVALLFDSHMDVVGVSGDWTVDPFGGEIRDGRLYGRGTTDMKGALAASLCGVSEAARTGRLTRPVAVSASVLEETVEGAALALVLDRIKPEMCVICEPSSLSIKTGQKGRIEIVVETIGIPSHAAHPERGRNPVLLAARALIAIEAMDLMADDALGPMLMVPTDIKSDPYPLVSALPSSVSIRFDRRIGTGDECDKVLTELKALLDGIEPGAFRVHVTADPVTTYTGETRCWDRLLPAWNTGADSDLARAAAQGLRAAGREVVYGTYAFCTNGSEAAGRRGLPTIGLGPGDEADAHINDESISLDDLTGAVDIYRHLTLEIAGRPHGS